MTGLKKLIHEAHRRSLWQVLGIYLVASWLVFQVAQTLTEGLGLPDWVPPFALILLLIGLPIVIGTAFVQEGMGGGEVAASTEPEPRAKGADSGEDTPAAELDDGRAHHRLFTWRNAILGGVAAFALLGVVTAGYMTMRTLGVGPAGTLVAKGMLEEGVDVVLADFQSSDPELGDVVTGALRIDLVESPTIRIVARSELAEALSRMQRDENSPITGDVARELAVREGYGAIIEGNVGTAGSGYVLTASILGGEGWEPLAGFRTTAKSDDDLIDAIEELSRDIREKAGESLRSVQSAPPLDQVTTASLEALRTYTRAEALEGEGDQETALELYERAVSIDPSFAMAYRKIGVALGNMNVRREDEIDALTRAFELRERLPQREQLQAEAYYHVSVTGDREAVIRTYEALLEIDPDDIAALNNLGIAYRERDRLEESERLLNRAVAVEAFNVGFENLAQTRARMGRPGPAEAALDSGIAYLPRATFGFEEYRVELAASLGRYEAADSMIAAYEARFRGPDALSSAAQLRFRLEAVRGRLRSAAKSLEDFGVTSGFWTNPMAVAYLRSSLALVEGDREAAARITLDAHDRLRDSLPPGDRRYSLTLVTLLEAGKSAEAERLFAEWQELVPDDALGAVGRDDRRGIQARLAFARGDHEGATRLWEELRRECPGRPPCSLYAAEGLARIHEAAGDAAAAIVEYERLLSEPFMNRFWFDTRHRGPALERLGQLYDEAADLENAAKYYAMFVELWRDADPVLQPRVQAAQQRLDEIFAERG